MVSVSITIKYFIKHYKPTNNSKNSSKIRQDWLGDIDPDKSKFIYKPFENLKYTCQRLKERVYKFKEDFIDTYENLINPLTSELQNRSNNINSTQWGLRYKQLAETYHTTLDFGLTAPANLSRCVVDLFSKYNMYAIKVKTIGVKDSIKGLWTGNSRPKELDMLENSLGSFNIKVPQSIKGLKALSSDQCDTIRKEMIRNFPGYRKDGCTLDHLANHTLTTIQESISCSHYTFALTVFSSAIVLGSIFTLANKLNPSSPTDILTRNSIFRFDESEVVNIVRLRVPDVKESYIYNVGISNEQHPAAHYQDTVHFTFRSLFEYRGRSNEVALFNDRLSVYFERMCLVHDKVQYRFVDNYIPASGERLCIGQDYHVFNWENAEASFDVIRESTDTSSFFSAEIFPITPLDFITLINTTSEMLVYL